MRPILNTKESGSSKDGVGSAMPRMKGAMLNARGGGSAPPDPKPSKLDLALQDLDTATLLRALRDDEELEQIYKEFESEIREDGLLAGLGGGDGGAKEAERAARRERIRARREARERDGGPPLSASKTPIRREEILAGMKDGGVPVKSWLLIAAAVGIGFYHLRRTSKEPDEKARGKRRRRLASDMKKGSSGRGRKGAGKIRRAQRLNETEASLPQEWLEEAAAKPKPKPKKKTAAPKKRRFWRRAPKPAADAELDASPKEEGAEDSCVAPSEANDSEANGSVASSEPPSVTDASSQELSLYSDEDRQAIIEALGDESGDDARDGGWHTAGAGRGAKGTKPEVPQQLEYSQPQSPLLSPEPAGQTSANAVKAHGKVDGGEAEGIEGSGDKANVHEADRGAGDGDEDNCSNGSSGNSKDSKSNSDEDRIGNVSGGNGNGSRGAHKRGWQTADRGSKGTKPHERRQPWTRRPQKQWASRQGDEGLISASHGSNGEGSNGAHKGNWQAARRIKGTKAGVRWQPGTRRQQQRASIPSSGEDGRKGQDSPGLATRASAATSSVEVCGKDTSAEANSSNYNKTYRRAEGFKAGAWQQSKTHHQSKTQKPKTHHQPKTRLHRQPQSPLLGSGEEGGNEQAWPSLVAQSPATDVSVVEVGANDKGDGSGSDKADYTKVNGGEGSGDKGNGEADSREGDGGEHEGSQGDVGESSGEKSGDDAEGNKGGGGEGHIDNGNGEDDDAESDDSEGDRAEGDNHRVDNGDSGKRSLRYDAPSFQMTDGGDAEGDESEGDGMDGDNRTVDSGDSGKRSLRHDAPSFQMMDSPPSPRHDASSPRHKTSSLRHDAPAFCPGGWSLPNPDDAALAGPPQGEERASAAGPREEELAEVPGRKGKGRVTRGADGPACAAASPAREDLGA